MAAIFIIPGGVHTINYAGANETVLCGGNVRAPHGVGLRRHVAVFLDNNLTVALGTTESTEPNGFFSLSVPGLPTTLFTVVAIGADNERSSIYSGCREF